jgi:hypothetical protein
MDTTLTKYLSQTTDSNNYLVLANTNNHQYIGDFEAVYDCYAANFPGEIKNWLQNKMLLNALPFNSLFSLLAKQRLSNSLLTNTKRTLRLRRK